MREFLAEHWDDAIQVFFMSFTFALGYLRGRADGRWDGYHKGRASVMNSALTELLQGLCGKANCRIEIGNGEFRVVDLPGKVEVAE